MVFPLVGISVEGVLIREASVMMVEKVAETGDETNSPLVIMSMNSVLTVVVLVLLSIVLLED